MHLFRAYFYEAWDEYEYDSWQGAVDDFARRSPERVAGAAAALRALLDEPLTDDQLDSRLRAQGCTFVSENGDRAWLTLEYGHRLFFSKDPDKVLEIVRGRPSIYANQGAALMERLFVIGRGVIQQIALGLRQDTEAGYRNEKN